MQIPEYISALIQKYQDGTTSSEENQLLDAWYRSFDDTEVTVYSMEMESEAGISSRIKARLDGHMAEKGIIKPLYKWKLPAAAAILLLVASAMFYFGNNRKSLKTDRAEIAKRLIFKNDVSPGGNKAILTLADGSTIVLDSASNGTLTQQGNIKVQKLSNGLLAYTINGKQVTENDALFYNTISTPRGGKYQMILEDGTKVWLNAASSIRFPVIFTGKERKVSITGEAYFEVAKNKEMPFRVDAAASEIEVLGTHFNINSYNDETAIRTTLLEGAVKVVNTTATANQQTGFLKPGQQSSINKEGKLNIINNADTTEAMAWMHGQFQFASADLKTILRQISRWYNVDIIYKGNTDLHFTGQLSRSDNASKIFEQLAMTGEVNFKIENKNIIVSPN